MKRKALLINIPAQNPPKTQSEYVQAVSQVASYDGQQYLNIDLFYKGELKGRYFADRLTYACYINGFWRTCRMDNIARICVGKKPLNGNGLYYEKTEWDWNSKKDETIAHEYLHKSLGWYESDIGTTKYQDALKRKENRIANMMSQVPTLPEGLETWLKEKIFPENYLFAKRGKKRTDYICTACGAKGWKKTGWKHNESTACPKCGQAVTVCMRKEEVQKKEPVTVLQTMGKYDWVERQLRAICTWTQGEKRIKILEDIRAVISKSRNYGKVWYGTLRMADEFEQDFWDRNQANKKFLESYLYPGNLKEVLPYGNELIHSGLDIIAEKQRKINVNTFILTIRAREWMEYWIKAGLITLTADVTRIYGMWGNPSYIRESGEKLTDNLQINGNRVQRLKNMDGGLNALKWMQYEEKREREGKKIKISQESLEFLDKGRISPEGCREILKALGSVNRMVNYMKKQRIAPGRVIGTWNDYLRMAADEGMDVTDDIVRLPKDLKARHDQLVEQINERNDEEKMKRDATKYKKLNHQIAEHLPEAKRYFWEDKDYMIIPAGKCEELIKEGKSLHHCVGSSDIYMNRMAAGESWILFLRKKKELEKAYYTIEISMKSDKILQWYSAYDRKPDSKKIEKVLEAFKKSIRRKNERVRIAG